MATIAVLGTLDTKGHEHAFVAERIRARGHKTILIDVGTATAPVVRPDISRLEVAAAAGIDPAALAAGDRGAGVAAMASAAPRLLERLHAAGTIDAVIALGGGGGTAIASAAMRGLPIGVPKVIVSTLASGNTAAYVGASDIVMMPAVVDIQGINRVSRMILSRAAGAICGMVEAEIVGGAVEKPLVVASMFGNTTGCVQTAMGMLEAAGYEVLVFHATGTGGRVLESLVASGIVAGVLDITTTELADELVGGVLSAGPDRLDAAARYGVPAVVAPGCLDMVNFGEPATVPERFRGRRLVAHNPQVTLMRTSVEEAARLGAVVAAKVNASRGRVTVMIPRRGVSALGVAGGPFHDPEADAVLFAALREGLRPDIACIELDCDINDPVFARACATALLENMRLRTVPTQDQS